MISNKANEPPEDKKETITESSPSVSKEPSKNKVKAKSARAPKRKKDFLDKDDNGKSEKPEDQKSNAELLESTDSLSQMIDSCLDEGQFSENDTSAENESPAHESIGSMKDLLNKVDSEKQFSEPIKSKNSGLIDAAESEIQEEQKNNFSLLNEEQKPEQEGNSLKNQIKSRFRTLDETPSKEEDSKPPDPQEEDEEKSAAVSSFDAISSTSLDQVETVQVVDEEIKVPLNINQNVSSGDITDVAVIETEDEDEEVKSESDFSLISSTSLDAIESEKTDEPPTNEIDQKDLTIDSTYESSLKDEIEKPEEKDSDIKPDSDFGLVSSTSLDAIESEKTDESPTNEIEQKDLTIDGAHEDSQEASEVEQFELVSSTTVDSLEEDLLKDEIEKPEEKDDHVKIDSDFSAVSSTSLDKIESDPVIKDLPEEMEETNSLIESPDSDKEETFDLVSSTTLDTLGEDLLKDEIAEPEEEIKPDSDLSEISSTPLDKVDSEPEDKPEKVNSDVTFEPDFNVVSSLSMNDLEPIQIEDEINEKKTEQESLPSIDRLETADEAVTDDVFNINVDQTVIEKEEQSEVDPSVASGFNIVGSELDDDDDYDLEPTIEEKLAFSNIPSLGLDDTRLHSNIEQDSESENKKRKTSAIDSIVSSAVYDPREASEEELSTLDTIADHSEKKIDPPQSLKSQGKTSGILSSLIKRTKESEAFKMPDDKEIDSPNSDSFIEEFPSSTQNTGSGKSLETPDSIIDEEVVESDDIDLVVSSVIKKLEIEDIPAPKIDLSESITKPFTERVLEESIEKPVILEEIQNADNMASTVANQMDVENTSSADSSSATDSSAINPAIDIPLVDIPPPNPSATQPVSDIGLLKSSVESLRAGGGKLDFDYANKLFLEGRLDEASVHLNMIVNKLSTEANADKEILSKSLEVLGDICILLDDPEEAVRCFDDSRQIQGVEGVRVGKYLTGMLKLATRYRENGNYKEAEEVYQKAIQIAGFELPEDDIMHERINTAFVNMKKSRLDAGSTLSPDDVASLRERKLESLNITSNNPILEEKAHKQRDSEEKPVLPKRSVEFQTTQVLSRFSERPMVRAMNSLPVQIVLQVLMFACAVAIFIVLTPMGNVDTTAINIDLKGEFKSVDGLYSTNFKDNELFIWDRAKIKSTKWTIMHGEGDDLFKLMNGHMNVKTRFFTIKPSLFINGGEPKSVSDDTGRTLYRESAPEIAVAKQMWWYSGFASWHYGEKNCYPESSHPWYKVSPGFAYSNPFTGKSTYSQITTTTGAAFKLLPIHIASGKVWPDEKRPSPGQINCICFDKARFFIRGFDRNKKMITGSTPGKAFYIELKDGKNVTQAHLESFGKVKTEQADDTPTRIVVIPKGNDLPGKFGTLCTAGNAIVVPFFLISFVFFAIRLFQKKLRWNHYFLLIASLALAFYWFKISLSL